MKTKKKLFPIFVFLIIIIIHLWDNFCNETFCDGAQCFFLADLFVDLRDSIIYVFEEELIFRMIPFLFVSILINFVKEKWLKTVLFIFGIVLILSSQVVFGALHRSFEDVGYFEPIIIHGVAGIIISVAYAGVLFYMLKKRLKGGNLNFRKKIKPILFSNFIAFCVSSLVHASSNVMMIIKQQF